MDALKEYVAGFAAGVAMVAVGHPFDTVKVKLQAHNTEGHEKKYKNALHCTTQILRTEGVKGLYRGATSSFIGISIESSIAFGLYSQTKAVLQGNMESGKPHIQAIAPAGAFAGTLISLILCPSELVKCRLQVQSAEPGAYKGHQPRYNGPLDCVLRTVKDEGMMGLFRGGSATFIREVIGNSVFFSTYEFSRYYMHNGVNSLFTPTDSQKVLVDVGIGILSGGLGGIACWNVVLPIDLAKTIIQTDITANRNPFITLHSVYRRVGLRGCYSGLGPTLMRAFPANAAAIVAWEFTAKVLGVERQ